MCSIILRITETGTFIAANRDEMVARPWQPPAEYWPGIIAGRDILAGGTWLGLNTHGVCAAVLNRHGSLGPAPNKRSRGELPLRALAAPTAAAAAANIATLDAGAYRSFNLVIADGNQAFFVAGLETGTPVITSLPPGTSMITAGEPNDPHLPRIARYLPKFKVAPFAHWAALLEDNAPPLDSALNIPEQNGFATVCSTLIALKKNGPAAWQFAPGPAENFAFAAIGQGVLF